MKTNMHLFFPNLGCSLWNCHYFLELLFKYSAYVQVGYFLNGHKYKGLILFQQHDIKQKTKDITVQLKKKRERKG